MKSFDKHFAAKLLPLILLAALGGCGVLGGGRSAGDFAIAPAGNGPAADYPVVIGGSYTVNGVTYTPADVLNYDEVGYATLDGQGGDAVTGAHHTLPLPSYVEVTSLESGRTILLRLERRGPMAGNELIGLSPGAAEQLGASAGSPVRVRRVNPQEPERAALRAGGRTPERMETPASLVEVLRRKLPGGAQATTVPASPSPSPSVASPAPAAPATTEANFDTAFAPVATETTPANPPVDEPAPITPDAPVVTTEVAIAVPAEQTAERRDTAPSGRNYVVQAGAFSSKDRADRVAGAVSGEVSKSGSLYRVRTGPFASRQEAEASLAKVKAAGYSDARIFPNG